MIRKSSVVLGKWILQYSALSLVLKAGKFLDLIAAPNSCEVPQNAG